MGQRQLERQLERQLDKDLLPGCWQCNESMAMKACTAILRSALQRVCTSEEASCRVLELALLAWQGLSSGLNAFCTTPLACCDRIFDVLDDSLPARLMLCTMIS